jgi:hypothetical protein
MMAWQDLVITLVSFVISFSLIPQVTHGFRTKKGDVLLQSSVPIALCLTILAYTYLTLDLFLSSISGFITAGLWYILVFQRIRYK